MLENWSLILNVLLLIGVLVAIGFALKVRNRTVNPNRFQPSLGVTPTQETTGFTDDIISVRQIVREEAQASQEEIDYKLNKKPTLKSYTPKLTIKDEPKPMPEARSTNNTCPSSIMMFLLAKEGRQFAGYEFLQTVLAAGLRFGEGQLFHRHQFSNGKGPILCSLASATASGVFDLQNIGAFSVKGLCLFMQTSNNPTIDAERFSIMLETARQLSEGLDALLLDDKRQTLTEERLEGYYNLLNIDKREFSYETAS